MATTQNTRLQRVGVLARTSAVALIAGVCRWRSIREINDSITARPIIDQVFITVAVLAILFALCIVAAQFGWIATLAFWLGVIILVN